MNKNIGIALVVLFALGAISASAETTGTTIAGSVTTTNTGTVGLPPRPPMPPAFRDTRTEMEAREKVLRQTQQASFGDRAKEMRGEVKNTREEMEARAKALRASTAAARINMKDEAQKKRLEIARKQTELVTKRLEAAIERVQKLSDRVTERLNKLEAEGVNVTVSRGHIAEAKVKLEEARTKTAAVKLAIETIFASATASTTPKDSFKKVQELVKDTVRSIQEAHRHVALAISSVKPGLNKPRPATTTPATTTSTTTQ